MAFIGETKGLVLNVPEWFEDDEFINWVNNPDNQVMTWHNRGAPPNDYSDTVVFVCPSLSGEGAESDMPVRYWDQIIAACREHFRPMESDMMLTVRLTNLEI